VGADKLPGAIHRVTAWCFDSTFQYPILKHTAPPFIHQAFLPL